MHISVYSYILFADRPKEAHFIRDADVLANDIYDIKVDHIFNIKGLGRLKVIRVIENIYGDEYDENKAYHEIGFVVVKIDDYWEPQKTAVAVCCLMENLKTKGVGWVI